MELRTRPETIDESGGMNKIITLYWIIVLMQSQPLKQVYVHAYIQARGSMCMHKSSPTLSVSMIAIVSSSSRVSPTCFSHSTSVRDSFFIDFEFAAEQPIIEGYKRIAIAEEKTGSKVKRGNIVPFCLFLRKDGGNEATG